MSLSFIMGVQAPFPEDQDDLAEDLIKFFETPDTELPREGLAWLEDGDKSSGAVTDRLPLQTIRNLAETVPDRGVSQVHRETRSVLRKILREMGDGVMMVAVGGVLLMGLIVLGGGSALLEWLQKRVGYKPPNA